MVQAQSQKTQIKERFKLELFSVGGYEIKRIATEKAAREAAASWYSRGVRVKLTDTKTGRVIYGE